jgi:hypothetical protein
MDETYRMLGREREADLEREAEKWRRASEFKRGSRAQRTAAAAPNVVRRWNRLHAVLGRLVGRAGLATRVELEKER